MITVGRMPPQALRPGYVDQSQGSGLDGKKEVNRQNWAATRRAYPLLLATAAEKRNRTRDQGSKQQAETRTAADPWRSGPPGSQTSTRLQIEITPRYGGDSGRSSAASASRGRVQESSGVRGGVQDGAGGTRGGQRAPRPLVPKQYKSEDNLYTDDFAVEDSGQWRIQPGVVSRRRSTFATQAPITTSGSPRPPSSSDSSVRRSSSYDQLLDMKDDEGHQGPKGLGRWGIVVGRPASKEFPQVVRDVAFRGRSSTLGAASGGGRLPQGSLSNRPSILIHPKVVIIPAPQTREPPQHGGRAPPVPPVQPARDVRGRNKYGAPRHLDESELPKPNTVSHMRMMFENQPQQQYHWSAPGGPLVPGSPVGSPVRKTAEQGLGPTTRGPTAPGVMKRKTAIKMSPEEAARVRKRTDAIQLPPGTHQAATSRAVPPVGLMSPKAGPLSSSSKSQRGPPLASIQLPAAPRAVPPTGIRSPEVSPGGPQAPSSSAPSSKSHVGQSGAPPVEFRSVAPPTGIRVPVSPSGGRPDGVRVQIGHWNDRSASRPYAPSLAPPKKVCVVPPLSPPGPVLQAPKAREEAPRSPQVVVVVDQRKEAPQTVSPVEDLSAPLEKVDDNNNDSGAPLRIVGVQTKKGDAGLPAPSIKDPVPSAPTIDDPVPSAPPPATVAAVDPPAAVLSPEEKPKMDRRPLTSAEVVPPPATQDNNTDKGLFVGDSVVVGRSSLSKSRSKKLKIAFDDKALSTYEYPSESSLLDSESLAYLEDKDKLKPHPVGFGSPGGLDSYTPKAFRNAPEFKLGDSRSQPAVAEPASDSPLIQEREESNFLDDPHITVKPAPDDQTTAFTMNTETSDMLF